MRTDASGGVSIQLLLGEKSRDLIGNLGVVQIGHQEVCVAADANRRKVHQPGVTGPIIGPRTVEQLESAVSALEIRLSDDDLSALDELFPGPGGQAPEAYAW